MLILYNILCICYWYRCLIGVRGSHGTRVVIAKYQSFCSLCKSVHNGNLKHSDHKDRKWWRVFLGVVYVPLGGVLFFIIFGCFMHLNVSNTLIFLKNSLNIFSGSWVFYFWGRLFDNSKEVHTLLNYSFCSMCIIEGFSVVIWQLNCGYVYLDHTLPPYPLSSALIYRT